ncbi:MAG: hypothetical protein UF228_07975 [Lachnospiraceae bacterium]|nr:hypothetical protein [Lachnospiraceae bacterium]
MDRRRTLLAASAASGGGGSNELPIIPDGFFPLYLTHDSYDRINDYYEFNPTDTTRELWNIVYGYASILCEYDGWGYDFYPLDYGIEVYLDGILLTNFYVYRDGHSEIFTDDFGFTGGLNDDGSLWYNFS